MRSASDMGDSAIDSDALTMEVDDALSQVRCLMLRCIDDGIPLHG